MKKFKKIMSWLLVIVVCILPFFPVSLLIWKSTTTQNVFVLANYQSYIDNIGSDGSDGEEAYDPVSKHLTDEFGVSYDYFESAEAALNLLKKNTADIVNTTTYELVNWVQQDSKHPIIQKLDWSKFKIPGINNADDALTLFIPEIRDVLTDYDLDKDGMNDNLLEYGIPYFLQDYIFAYRGDAIAELEGPLTWKQLIDNLSSPGVKERFAATKYPQIFAVEDARGFFSIANNIHKEEVGKDIDLEFNDMNRAYLDLAHRFNKISPNVMGINPDANIVLNKLAKEEVKGAFCYNGDALFASFGGDEEAEENVTESNFHIVKPTDTIAALDMFVINGNLKDQQKIDKAYGVLGQLCLGIYQKEDGQQAFPTDADYAPENSWTYRNFNYVNYTAPLLTVNKYIQDNYFDDSPWRKNIFDIQSLTKANFEKNITDIQKSDIAFAWVNFKAALN